MFVVLEIQKMYLNDRPSPWKGSLDDTCPPLETVQQIIFLSVHPEVKM